MTRSRIALVLALVALFAGATTTAYSAGLAKNSVGTAQLKKNAVTTPKIKRGAVTASKIKKGVVAPKTKTYSRELTVSNADLTYFSVGGLRFTGACKSVTQDSSFLDVKPTAPGGLLTYTGTLTIQNTGGDSSAPETSSGPTNEYSQWDIVSVAGNFSETSFIGQITPVGKPPVLVQIFTEVTDGNNPACKVTITATPTA